MAFKWSRDLIENLIVCVEQNTCIYNVRSTEYLDRNKKAQAFHSISEELVEMEPGITVDNIKRKWKVLRTQYMQELRSMNQSKKSGSGKADVYVPKLWCFHQLDFLKIHSEMRQSKDNTQDEENDECNVQQPVVQSEEPPKKRHKASAFRKDLSNVQNMLRERKSEKPFAWLGTLVTNQMERISPDDQDDASFQVQCLMHELIKKSRNLTMPTSSTSRDIISLSMESVFEDGDQNLSF